MLLQTLLAIIPPCYLTSLTHYLTNALPYYLTTSLPHYLTTFTTLRPYYQVLLQILLAILAVGLPCIAAICIVLGVRGNSVEVVVVEANPNPDPNPDPNPNPNPDPNQVVAVEANPDPNQ